MWVPYPVSMRIRVRLLGNEAAVVGSDHVDVMLRVAAPTAGDVLVAIGEAAPSLKGGMKGIRVAVNHQFVGTEVVIKAGDEVALIGLVSGG